MACLAARFVIRMNSNGTEIHHFHRAAREPLAMIHYSCDLCRRPLDPEDELRYIVKMEVYASIDPMGLDDAELDRDHLQDLDEIIEQMDDLSNDAISADVLQRLRFDLCPECRKKFLANPLGRKGAEQFNFSKN